MDRRSFLARSGLAGSALVLGGVPVFADAARTRRKRIPLAGGGTFAEGIASGETSTNAATLWTRLGGYRTDRRLGLEIASDPGFRHVVHRRSVVARAAHDHTIKARVGGRFLKPGERYWYRFEGAHSHSPVGRFQTLRPADSNEPVRIAFFSCQDWQAGYFGAHRTLAERDDLDLVVGLGDYIYERNFYEGPRTDTLGANDDGEVQTLDEYRAAYRMWRSDADLRAMHAAHPVLATWDDHEVEDNYAGGKPGEATENPRVPFAGRRSNGWLAFSEYQAVLPCWARSARASTAACGSVATPSSSSPTIAPIATTSPAATRSPRRARPRRPTSRAARCSGPRRRAGSRTACAARGPRGS